MTLNCPDRISFPRIEEDILKYWEEIDAFKEQLRRSEDLPEFSFFDGPPFATGLPHYGHLLAGTIKDVVCRYQAQNGFHVTRRFGWDTHGLPVEYEIDTKLGITGPEDVEAMGIAAYNAECRSIVMRYSKQWETIVTRTGRWIDFEDDYKTLDPTFMESVWWVFGQLFDKGLIYRGVKVMPYSVPCATPLSNFEANQNYKDVQDPAVVVTFPVRDRTFELMAWTTTPWTLPSNLVLCVNEELEYTHLKDLATEREYVMATARICELYPAPKKGKKGKKKAAAGPKYEVIGTMTGKDLVGLQYEPLFPYFEDMRAQGAFHVLSDNYVSADSGVGIVHIAPFFGEEDYRVCLQAGVIKRDGRVICPVDQSGRFTEEVADYQGVYVKGADKQIIADLKSRGRLIKQAVIQHSYPFCWRSDTPLIYRAVPSWFVRVESLRDRLVANNKKAEWVPKNIQTGRFHNWLANARDWAISRNRYWGTPMPVWESEDGTVHKIISSVAQLEELTGETVTDLHRDKIDHLEIADPRGPDFPPLRRIKETLDCWFESGSMPYAQSHYPFENKERFQSSFPADFIAEGVDQTRGWFYTLLVLSTALFDEPPAKHVIVNGLVLAEDGQKMSKRLKNYPPVTNILDDLGADALRMYLCHSPAVRARELKFRREGVRDISKDVFNPWFHSFRFMAQNVKRHDDMNPDAPFRPSVHPQSSHIMDKWILASLRKLNVFIVQEMDAYRLYTALPALLRFINEFTNWYIRLNRNRIKGMMGPEHQRYTLDVLFYVFINLSTLMAPFTPFFTEWTYQRLRPLLAADHPLNQPSVHFLRIPMVSEEYEDEEVIRKVTTMRQAIVLGRMIRADKCGISSARTPLQSVTVLHHQAQVLADCEELKDYFLSELSVQEIFTTSEQEGLAKLDVAPDFRSLRDDVPRSKMKDVSKAIRKLSHEQILQLRDVGSLELVPGVTITTKHCQVMLQPVEREGFASAADGALMMSFSLTRSQELKILGATREVFAKVQQLRKILQLVPGELADVFVVAPHAEVLIAGFGPVAGKVSVVETLPEGCESLTLKTELGDAHVGMVKAVVE